jgi:transcriptional regulator with XRE-family HTH domain
MEKLTKWREAQGLSRGELAQAIGCNRSQIGRWESGLSYPRSFEAIERIARLTDGQVTILHWYESWLNRSE